MGIKLSVEKFDKCIKELQKNYKIYAPVLMEGKGTFSDTDTVRYAEINSITDIEFQKRLTSQLKKSYFQ